MMLLSACAAPSINKNVLKPPRYPEMSNAKRIAVIPPEKYHKVNISSKLESILASIRINNKPHFIMVDRGTIEGVMKEQRFSEKSITDQKTAIRLGKLISADTLVTTNFTASKLSTERYRDERTKCLDKKCKQQTTYYVNCKKNSVTVTMEPKATNTQTGSLRYSQAYANTQSSSMCDGDGKAALGEAQLTEDAVTSILNDIKKDVAPYVVVLNVPFMESDKSKMPSEVAQIFKFGLKWLGDGRYDLGCRKMKSLLSMYKESPAILYNNGVCEELNGDMGAAEVLYRAADDKAFDTNQSYDEINQAIHRIDHKDGAPMPASSAVEKKENHHLSDGVSKAMNSLFSVL